VPSREIGHRDQEARSRRIQTLLGGMEAAADVPTIVTSIATGVKPNVRFSPGAEDVAFLEKRVGEATVFFLRNEAEAQRRLEIEFPIRTAPERWDAWTGEISPETGFIRTESGVRVPVILTAKETRIIVFDPRNRHEPAARAAEARVVENLPVNGTWLLKAGPVTRTVTALFDWAADPGLRGFSGSATYTTVVSVPVSLVEDRRLVLRLGEVRDVAEVRVNGRDLPPLLFAPYEVDVTGFIRPGENTLEVRVTNTQTNELLARGADLAGLFKDEVFKTPMRSGLLGPVSLSSAGD